MKFKTLAGVNPLKNELCIFNVSLEDLPDNKHKFNMTATIGKPSYDENLIDTNGYSQELNDYIGYFGTLLHWHDWLYTLYVNYQNKELPAGLYDAIIELFRVYDNHSLDQDIKDYIDSMTSTQKSD